jgi:hypothetical protein
MARLLLPTFQNRAILEPSSRFDTVAQRSGGTSATPDVIRMKQTTIQTLYTYWDGVRAGRIAPRRLEVEPARIAAILSETFMLECGEGDYQYRLAGSRLCELFGYELRGTSFLSGWSEADRALIERQMAAVRGEGAVARLAIEAGIDARHRIELEVVLLPLLHAGNSVGRVIGAMSPTSQPQWLDQGRLTSRRLLRHELVRPERLRDGAPLNGDRQAPLLPALTGLRVVHSQRRQFRVLDGGLSAGKHGKS